MSPKNDFRQCSHTWFFYRAQHLREVTNGFHPGNNFCKSLERSPFDTVHGSEIPETNILLMAEILHQLVWRISRYLHGFIHPRWCRIVSINSITLSSWNKTHLNSLFPVSGPMKKPKQNTVLKTSESNLPAVKSVNSSWWFQPIWKIWVKLDHLPR